MSWTARALWPFFDDGDDVLLLARPPVSITTTEVHLVLHDNGVLCLVGSGVHVFVAETSIATEVEVASVVCVPDGPIAAVVDAGHALDVSDLRVIVEPEAS